MPTFVEITPDAFATTFSNVAQQSGAANLNGNRSADTDRFFHVRRPVRGITIKDDTYATLQVRQSNGEPIALFDGGADGGSGNSTSNFLIQSVAEQRAEKQQIVLTFGEPYIFFFGEQPRVINVSGILLNTEDFKWRAEWWENYDKILRGTACVRSRSRVYLSWDDIVVEGYIMSSDAQETATEQNYVRFNFQMFLTNYQNVSNINGQMIQSYVDANLDPDTTNFISSLGQGQSTLLLVQQQNQIMQNLLQNGSGKDSLLAGLRVAALADASSGSFASGTNRLVEINGQVLDILAAAGDFIAGRNIRVPIGFEGSTVFDDAQSALASIPGAQSVISGTSSTTSQSVEIAGHTYTIIRPGLVTVPPNITGKYSDNTDEFVARSQVGVWGGGDNIQPPDFYRDQRADAVMADNAARDAFEKAGVDIDDMPSELTLAFRKSMFGIALVVAGANLNSTSGTAAFLKNLL